MKQILLITLGLSVALLADFTKSGNIVTDRSTGLQWQDDATIGTTKITWSSAIEHCENLTLDGHSDWRLPNIKELISTAKDTKHYPSIDAVFRITESTYYFPNNHYWSSTTFAGNSSHAWFIQLNDGLHWSEDKTNSYYVRCVREGR